MRPPDRPDPHHAPTGLVRLIDVAEADTKLIEGWLRAAHVQRWWGDPEENLARLGTPAVGLRRAIIEADGRKVGLVLWGHPPREELDQAGLHDISTDAIDIDIMIGETDAVGRGIGAAAIRLVVADVFANTSAPYLIAATMTGNVASRKAFEKAGFSADREFDDPPYGRCILMLCRRQRPRESVAHLHRGGLPIESCKRNGNPHRSPLTPALSPEGRGGTPQAQPATNLSLRPFVPNGVRERGRPPQAGG